MAVNISKNTQKLCGQPRFIVLHRLLLNLHDKHLRKLSQKSFHLSEKYLKKAIKMLCLRHFLEV